MRLGNKDELLSAAARVESCDVLGLVTEIVNWAEEELRNSADDQDNEVYNTLNTVAYTILEHCQID